MVARHALGSHRPELMVQPGPELLQTHTPTLTRATARTAACPAYARPMFPGTGSATWDTVLQIGIALTLLVSIVLLIRNYRGR